MPPEDQESPKVTGNFTSARHEVHTLLTWSAPGRPFEKKGREYFANIFIILLAVLVILFLFSQYMLMLLAIAVVFMTYALNTVPPHNFHYKISTEGVMVEDHFFIWQELYDFYFKKIHGSEVLHLRTKSYFPGELTIVLGEMTKDHVKSVLLPYLPYREYVKPTSLEKAGDWLGKTFPLDKAT